MIVADSNIIIRCLKSNYPLTKMQLLVPDDLHNEYEIAEIVHKTQIPGVVPASQLAGYDEAYYLKKYHKYLNTYSEVYFAQMRGFADVAIVALVSCLIDNFGSPKQQSLFDVDPSDVVTVATHDGPLKKKLKDEFNDRVKIIGYEDL